MRKLLQRTIEADRVLRAVVDRSLDCEDAEQGEHDEARGMADDAGGRADARVVAPLVLELLRDPAVEIPEPGADRDEPGGDHELTAGRPLQHDGRRLVCLLVLRLLAGAGEDARSAVGERDIDGGTPQVAEALAPLVVLPCLHDTPQRVRGEAGEEQDEDDLPERAAGERLQRPRAARRLAADADRDADREHADQRVADALGAEPGAAEGLLPVGDVAVCGDLHPLSERTGRVRGYVSVYSGPLPPSGGVSRPPLAVIAPHCTQFDGATFTVTVPSPPSVPIS